MTDNLPRRRRSAVSTGRRAFVDLGDGGSVWGRRYADLIAGHVADLGGADLLSESQVSLIKRASALECELEAMEGRLSLGEAVDLDEFGRATNTLRRTLESLGLGRVPRAVKSLSEHIAEHYPQHVVQPNNKEIEQ
jgi:hypothetical protein